jgi:arylamine N-acetyltransferase
MSNNPKYLSLYQRYLKILDIPQKNPGMVELKELVSAQLNRIPFENISKLYYNKRSGINGLIDFETYLDGIERYNFGGTCYSINYFLFCLLSFLGYNVKLCPADMDNPDVHIVNIVAFNKKEYLVDAGYAAPFISPIPLFQTIDLIINSGKDRYVLKPRQKNGRSQLQFYRDGHLHHGYVIKPQPRKIKYFDQIIGDSFREDATFMNAILLTRHTQNKSYRIQNMTLTETTASGSVIKEISDRQELCEIIYEKFSIPLEISKESISEIKKFKDF